MQSYTASTYHQNEKLRVEVANPYICTHAYRTRLPWMSGDKRPLSDICTRRGTRINPSAERIVGTRGGGLRLKIKYPQLRHHLGSIDITGSISALFTPPGRECGRSRVHTMIRWTTAPTGASAWSRMHMMSHGDTVLLSLYHCQQPGR